MRSKLFYIDSRLWKEPGPPYWDTITVGGTDDSKQEDWVLVPSVWLPKEEEKMIIHETLMLGAAKKLWEALDKNEDFCTPGLWADDLPADIFEAFKEFYDTFKEFYDTYKRELLKQGWKSIGLEEEEKEEENGEE